MEEIIKLEAGDFMLPRYLDYAVSVITDRALPDVRDGLKPVHRRIVYAMMVMGITSSKGYKKCARIVGEVLGKYHPHGDASVYDALVKLAQPFSMRYQIIDGHGNFGSVDGDGAAAMRYTECRLSPYGEYLLKNYNKDTVEFIPNFDGEEKEPIVLPNLIPNLLLNGTSGIAVGMATNIPSHNIHDIYNACYYLIDCMRNNVDADIEEIIKIVKAPDFATGGTIINPEGAAEGYRTGKGKFFIRSNYEIDDNNNIIINEIPYGVNKAKLVKDIDDLTKDVKDKKGKVIKKAIFPQIKEIRDESDKEGMRIFIELKKDSNPQVVINNLIKFTKFQRSFGMQMLCLVNKKPQYLTLKDILLNFLQHSATVIIKRTQFDLNKAKKRLNIVEGILTCLSPDPENPDEELLTRIIHITRVDDDPVNSIMKLGFNKEQADYIFASRLSSLSKNSQEKLRAEKDELLNVIEYYNSILNDDIYLLNVMEQEFKDIEKMFGDERRTQISHSTGVVKDEDLIVSRNVIVTYSNNGIIKSVPQDSYKAQKRGGKGVKAASTKEDEIIKYMFTCNNKDDLLFFTTAGKCYPLKAYQIDITSKTARGRNINNYLSLEPGEKILNILSTDLSHEDKYLLFVTKLGIIKKLAISELSSRAYTTVMTFKENDELVQALLVSDKDDVLIASAKGKSLRIKSDSIRPSGRKAMGVIGMNLDNDDEVIDMCFITDDTTILTFTDNGYGKRTKGSEWRICNRGGKGITAHNISDKTGSLCGILSVSDDNELFIVTEQGLLIRISVKDISVNGRSTLGARLIKTSGDRISSVSLVVEEDQNEEEVSD